LSICGKRKCRTVIGTTEKAVRDNIERCSYSTTSLYEIFAVNCSGGIPVDPFLFLGECAAELSESNHRCLIERDMIVMYKPSAVASSIEIAGDRNTFHKMKFLALLKKTSEIKSRLSVFFITELSVQQRR
jgi:hypothetical protein